MSSSFKLNQPKLRVSGFEDSHHDPLHGTGRVNHIQYRGLFSYSMLGRLGHSYNSFALTVKDHET